MLFILTLKICILYLLIFVQKISLKLLHGFIIQYICINMYVKLLQYNIKYVL